MNKNTALLNLIAVLAFRFWLFCSSHCILSYFFSSLVYYYCFFFVTVLACFFLVANVLTFLSSHCFSFLLFSLLSSCSYYFFSSLSLLPLFRRYFLIAFFRRCSRCLPSFLLFTLIITLSI